MSSFLDAIKAIGFPETEHIVRLVAAVILGGLIGFERELHDKPAGFRTIILICVGACLFTIVSQTMGGPDWNSTRIAAQIVTGIGFLGAGAIMRDRVAVMGLTTAATIWSVAAVGMACGFGELALGAVGALAILVTLALFDMVEHRVGRWRDIQDYRVRMPKTDDAIEKTSAMFASGRLRVRKRNWYEEESSLVVQIVAMGSKDAHDRMRMSLTKSEGHTLLRS